MTSFPFPKQTTLETLALVGDFFQLYDYSFVDNAQTGFNEFDVMAMSFSGTASK